MLRQPLVSVLGGVDSGKTTLQDFLRRTAVAQTEPGGITQMISSSSLSLKTIHRICGELLKEKNITIPGMVFIDTPGHAAFVNMRKRGGNLADIAVLVIDVTEGVKSQTEECIAILKHYKTPFLIALNKIDLLSGWRPLKSGTFLELFQQQSPEVQKLLDTKLYEVVGRMYDLGFQADRFDRVEDYTSTIAIVPCSAKQGTGVPEVVMVLIGLAQRFLVQELRLDQLAPAKGTVLEVKEETGVGTTLDVIIYEGKLRVNDQIVIGGIQGPILTKVRGLFLPGETKKFQPVKEVVAAAGVKIVAIGAKDVVAGMPLFVLSGNEEELRAQIQEEVAEVLIETDEEGVVVKADTLGSLEAVVFLLKEKMIPIKKASVGGVTKKDIATALANTDPLHRVVLCFNVRGESTEVKVLSHNVIYQLITEFEGWQEAERKKEEQKELLGLVRPAKILYLSGCTFRQNNPCVIGVEVLLGTLRPNVDLVKENGDDVGHIKTIELDKKSVPEADRGKQVAISIPGVTAGRQIHEKEVFYVNITEENFRRLKVLKRFLTPEETTILKEFAEIKRKTQALWGI